MKLWYYEEWSEDVLFSIKAKKIVYSEQSRYPQITQIELVEIDEAVVLASRAFLPQTASKLDDERVKLYFEDRVKWVQHQANETYDLIIIDARDSVGKN